LRPPYTNTSNRPTKLSFTHTRLPLTTSVSMRSVTGNVIGTGTCVDDD
jgi:hypothetical protein